MDLIVDQGLELPIVVTTNATQWSRRIERICSSMPVSVVVSLDGIHKRTYEQIRVGADFDQVMANVTRFIDTLRGGSADVSIAHCLMRSNWREFVDLLHYAEARGISHVGVNTVLNPRYLSLYQMEQAELAVVVAEMERQDVSEAARLGRMRAVWEEQLQSLQNRLRRLQSGASSSVNPWFTTQPSGSPAIAELEAWCDDGDLLVVTCENSAPVINGQEITRPIVRVDQRFEELVGLSGAELIGQPMSYVLDAMRRAYGDDCRVELELGEHGSNVLVRFPSTDGPDHLVRALFVEDGEYVKVLLGHGSGES